MKMIRFVPMFLLVMLLVGVSPAQTSGPPYGGGPPVTAPTPPAPPPPPPVWTPPCFYGCNTPVIIPPTAPCYRPVEVCHGHDGDLGHCHTEWQACH